MGIAARITKRTSLWLAWVLCVGMGCSLDGLLKSDELPPDITDPAITRTPEGALAAYWGTLALFREAFGGRLTFVAVTGLLSDELQNTTTIRAEDVRNLPEGDTHHWSRTTYNDLHDVRAQAGQAIGLLAAYVPEQPALRAHVYALEGFVEVFLAELFCSGIPLSTLDYDGDYTYRPGSSTREVLTHAIARFDTALSLAADSARVLELARIGKSRALLALGEYAEAATAVATVPDTYTYFVSFTNASELRAESFAAIDNRWHLTVANREGLTGLEYRTSGDPRIQVTQRGTTPPPNNVTIYHPNKYATDGSTPIVLASGTEARLIKAEAQLNAGDAGWLATLNALRTDGTFEVDSQAVTDTMVDNTVTPPDTTIDTTSWTYDTLWHAGTGGVAGLAPLDDPGTAEERVDLLFRERGFWLFLTGHRQGDLRRLIRQYGRLQHQVYPTGAYPRGGLLYGADVTAPIPDEERVLNPHFTGCASRGA